jgi:hypothetical protein
MADGPTLRDRALFWIALAAVLAAVGAVPAGIAAAATSAIHASPWTSVWFRVGIAAEILAVMSSMWSLILYVAHNHAEKHWCPDPSAHVLPSQIKQAPEPIASVSEIKPHIHQPRQDEKIRSVLRATRFVVRDAVRRVENAVKTGRYWSSTGNDGGPLPTRTWKKNREQLSGVAGLGDVYDALYEAFAHVERINAFHFARVIQGRAVKSDDRLDDALTALQKADQELSAKLLDLSA